MKSDNGYSEKIAQALNEIKEKYGERFNIDKVSIADMCRRTGLSRARIRKIKRDGFRILPDARTGRKALGTVISKYSGMMDCKLRSGVSNSDVLLGILRQEGYCGGLTTVKNYISSHAFLIPAKRAIVAPQGNRGRRYRTGPGEAYEMDWGFVDVIDGSGIEWRAACFAMICHHCGLQYIEFFPNAKQENLFIGMLHAFMLMGVPEHVLTDNMASVVKCRDMDGMPVWNVEYEMFMKAVGFSTKLCKPRHPFTKGAVERLVRFVKDNFIQGRTFLNVTDLNRQALLWCVEKNGIRRMEKDGIPSMMHEEDCMKKAKLLLIDDAVRLYTCPQRRISFDGFVYYEGRRFGVPCFYTGKTARVMRDKETLKIFSEDGLTLLATHPVTWSKAPSYCSGQFEETSQPEELPTAPVRSAIRIAGPQKADPAFERFNFSKER